VTRPSPAEDGGPRLSQGESDAPASLPRGSCLISSDEAESIADSTFIRAHIEGKYGFDFDAPLNLQQRAQAWAFRANDRAPPLLGTGWSALGRC